MFEVEFERYFKHICTSAFESSLPQGTIDWNVKEVLPENLIAHHKVILLTISSYRIRSIAALHFSVSDSLVKVLSQQLNLSDRYNLPEVQIHDYLSEMVNTLVGYIKRDLQQQILSLGMSTPTILDRNCLKFANESKTQHEFFLDASAENECVFAASFHTSVYGDLKLTQTNSVEKIEEGGLEFF